MASNSRTPQLDLCLSGFFIALSGIVIWGATKIPPPFFDPIGSAAFPKWTAYGIIALSFGVGIRALRALKTKRAPENRSYKVEPWLAVTVVAMAALYVYSMQSGALSFRWATLIFLFLESSILSRFDKRVMAVSALIATVFGFGGQYLFTEIFYIDLPQ